MSDTVECQESAESSYGVHGQIEVSMLRYLMPMRTSQKVLVLALVCGGREAYAQELVPARSTSDANVFAVNVALGAVTAGVWRVAMRKPFVGGLVRGAAAGAGVYAGKKIIAKETPLAWWGGRQIAAIASSEVSNAAEGLPILQRVVLPLGPIRIHFDRLAPRNVRPRLDALQSIAIVAFAVHPATRFSAKESLATGEIVFVNESDKFDGYHAAGVISLSEILTSEFLVPCKRRILSHELIHAAQYDFTFTAWSDGAQAAISRRLRSVAFITRFIDVNLTLPLPYVANRLVEYGYRPWEIEAYSIVHANGC
jgi:hypothetical protein